MSGCYGRPRGSYGEIGRAMLDAAGSGPAPVRELAQRAQVGYAAARYTASRLVSAGALRVVEDSRPVVLAAAWPDDDDDAVPLEQVLRRSFWEREPGVTG